MRSIAFPHMFNKTTTNIVSNYYATLQNLELLLLSTKGELFGDPYYGSNLKKYLYDQNDVILKDLIIDDIYSAIVLFMPQIKVNRKDIVITSDGKSKISISIKATDMASFETNMYNIVLLSTNV